MRPIKMLVLLLLGVFVLSSCNKITCHDEGNARLHGTWTWLSTRGGIAAHINETPQSTGITKELRFTEDGKYIFFKNGQVASEGTYATTTRKCIHDGKEKTWIDFSVPSDPDRMVEYRDESVLLLSDEAYDGVFEKYGRITVAGK